jgi:hypothetical protein
MITEFYETLHTGNIEKVAKLIEEKLTGKTYAFVSVNELFNFRPDVRTNQKMHEDKPVHIWFDEDNDPPNFAGFNINDTYGVWGLSTSQKTNEYDPTFNAPYVVIEYNQIKMTLRNSNGNLIHWVVAIQ